MKANYNNKKEATISAGTLYEMNQQLMANEPTIAEVAAQKAEEDISNFFAQYAHQKYFMLLCKEQSDYTVFNLEHYNATTNTSATEDCIEILRERGKWLAAVPQEDESGIAKSVEFWVKIDDIPHAYYLFPYGQAVLEY